MPVKFLLAMLFVGASGACSKANDSESRRSGPIIEATEGDGVTVSNGDEGFEVKVGGSTVTGDPGAISGKESLTIKPLRSVDPNLGELSSGIKDSGVGVEIRPNTGTDFADAPLTIRFEVVDWSEEQLASAVVYIKPMVGDPVVLENAALKIERQPPSAFISFQTLHKNATFQLGHRFKPVLPPTFSQLALTGSALDGVVNGKDADSATSLIADPVGNGFNAGTFALVESTKDCSTAPYPSQPGTKPTYSQLKGLTGTTYKVCVKLLGDGGSIFGSSATFQYDAAVLLSSTSSANAQTLTTKMTGTCEVGSNVTITYQDFAAAFGPRSDARNPETAGCVCPNGSTCAEYDGAGTYSFDVAFIGRAGNRTLTVSQGDKAGNSVSLVHTFDFAPGFVERAALKAQPGLWTGSGTIDGQYGSAVALGSTYMLVSERKAARAVGAPATDQSLPAAGAVYVYRKVGGVWTIEATLTASNREANDNFGRTLALDESGANPVAVVAAYFEDSNGSSQADNSAVDAGAAYVFERIGGTWTQTAYLKANTPAAGDTFGMDVDIHGSWIAVGAKFEDGSIAEGDAGTTSNSGAVYVYEKVGSTWTFRARLKASDAAADDEFGTSVDIDAATLLVGSWRDTFSGQTSAGSAYVFTRSGSTWSEAAKLTASNAQTDDGFGRSVALDGLIAVVGAPYEDSGNAGDEADNASVDSGALYAFVATDATWSSVGQEAYIKAPTIHAGDNLGTTVELSSTALLGAALLNRSLSPTDQANVAGSNVGAAYLFDRTGPGTWTFAKFLKPSNSSASHEMQFGIGMDIAPEGILIGAWVDSSNGVSSTGTASGLFQSGSAYLFARNSPWSQVQFLRSPQQFSNVSMIGPNEEFGFGLASGGDWLAVGAKDHYGNTARSNQGKGTSGGIHLFRRSQATWQPTGYLKPTVIDSRDFFGSVLDFDGSYLVVSSQTEDSDGSGGSESAIMANNAADGSGAAWIFKFDGSEWGQQAFLKATYPRVSDRFGIASAISGDTVAIGAHDEDGSDSVDDGDTASAQSGAAFVFRRAGDSWAKEAYLKASNLGAGDVFGSSLDLEGDLLVVGAPLEDGNANAKDKQGAAYVFERSGSTWTETKILRPQTGWEDAGDSFGQKVKIIGSTIFVSAPFEGSNSKSDGTDDSKGGCGAVYVFKKVGGVWTQVQYLKPDVPTADLRWGMNLEGRGSYLAVAALGGAAATSGGLVTVFELVNGLWTFRATVQGANWRTGDAFGEAMTIDDLGHVLLGGPGHDGAHDKPFSDNSRVNSGAVVIYQ